MASPALHVTEDWAEREARLIAMFTRSCAPRFRGQEAHGASRPRVLLQDLYALAESCSDSEEEIRETTQARSCAKVSKEASSASDAAGASQPAALRSTGARNVEPALRVLRTKKTSQVNKAEGASKAAQAAWRISKFRASYGCTRSAHSRSRSPRLRDRNAQAAPAARREVRNASVSLRLHEDINATNMGQSRKCKLSWEDIEEGIQMTTQLYRDKGMVLVTEDFKLLKNDASLHGELVIADFFPGKNDTERTMRRNLFCDKFFGPFEQDGPYRLRGAETTKWILTHEKFGDYFHEPHVLPQREWPKHLGEVFALVRRIEESPQFETMMKFPYFKKPKKMSTLIFKSCGKIGESIADYLRTELKREAGKRSKNRRGYENTKNEDYDISLDQCSLELQQRVWRWVRNQHYLSNPSKVNEKIGDLFEFAYFYFFINGRLDLIMELVVDHYMRWCETANDDMVQVIRYEKANRRIRCEKANRR